MKGKYHRTLMTTECDGRDAALFPIANRADRSYDLSRVAGTLPLRQISTLTWSLGGLRKAGGITGSHLPQRHDAFAAPSPSHATRANVAYRAVLGARLQRDASVR